MKTVENKRLSPISSVEVAPGATDNRWRANDVTPTKGDGCGLMLVLQRVPEPKTGKNRAHFDLVVDELEGPTARAEELGGRWIEPDKTHEFDGFSWRVMADPEGDEFCLYVMSESAVVPVLPSHGDGAKA